MKPSELRLGNLILSDLGEPLRVCTLGKNTIEVSQGGKTWTTCFRPKPIPLTQEWFEKLGFRHTGNNDWIKTDIIIHSGHHEFWYFAKTSIDVKIEFVHQLQNLYYILIDEELTAEGY